MKKVRMPKFVLWLFGGGAAFFGVISVIAWMQPEHGGGADTGGGLALFAAFELAALLFSLSCHIDYNEEIARRWTPLGWRTMRLSEIDRVEISDEDILFCAGRRKIRYAIWANDEGDFAGLIGRLEEARGADLPVAPTRFSAFSDRLFREQVHAPEQFVVAGIIMLSSAPVSGLMIAFSGKWLAAAKVAGFGLAIFGFLIAVFVFFVRRADRFPRIARMLVRPDHLRSRD